ncbi:putative hydrolase of the HAD superfamily [Prevotella sp. khp1]|uniref:HAD family hydrolase n=1 Tax=Prevotellaceae TaxID=171552 RepID=UPI000883C659|nr:MULTISPECIES: HAD family hydrolase [Prevotellaceae]QVJ80350.1 HAD family hydrolase [Xylanibacter ruminicola]SDQ23707.1 putative hydrolase of the HAD superfamily [Prevotella sp. khp1]
MLKGYIFDYGGTLDTGGQHWGKVIWHAYERQQVPVSEEAFRDAYVHAERTLGKNPIIQPDFTFYKTIETKIRIQLEYLQEENDVSSVSSYLKPLTDSLYEATVKETAKSREVLLQLKQQYPMVLVSNFYGNIATVLQEFKLDGIFDKIIESAVVGVRKPDPQIFTLGVEALGMRPDEVVVVGDSMDKDIIPAGKAGCHTVWFKGEGWTNDPVDESPAGKVITDLTQILENNEEKY